MIKSMTGFGRGENTDDLHSFSVEIKSVNHRYNDIIVRMPKHISYLEEKIKKHIKQKIARGRVEVYIKLEYIDEETMDVKVNIPLAKVYKTAIEELINELNIKDDIMLSHMMNFPELIKSERKELDEDIIWNCLFVALDLALENLLSMRREEGIALKEDMEAQIANINGKILEIEKRAPIVVNDYKDRLHDRINELLDDNYEVDEDRLNQEVAIFAEKSDINEEIVRLKSHIQQFKLSLNENMPVGRKLDFIVQEINREINTIGSKANDLKITNYVVDIKSELEKIREQIQNVE